MAAAAVAAAAGPCVQDFAGPGEGHGKVMGLMRICEFLPGKGNASAVRHVCSAAAHVLVLFGGCSSCALEPCSCSSCLLALCSVTSVSCMSMPSTVTACRTWPRVYAFRVP
eukprot:351062-Chlamydomonas_euryale.AAC.7